MISVTLSYHRLIGWACHHAPCKFNALRLVMAATGIRSIRAALNMAAVVAIRHHPDIRNPYIRLLDQRKSNMSTLGAAMRTYLPQSTKNE